MIRQPDFITAEMVCGALEKVKIKKPNPLYETIMLNTIQDGKCVEILHVGSYDDEPSSFEKMDRNIQLRSEGWGYRSASLALAAWTLFNCWQTFMNGAAYNPLPGFVLCFAVCVQGFSQLAMKQKMIVGDEEYKEPNKLLWTIIVAVMAAAIIVSIGTYFVMRV